MPCTPSSLCGCDFPRPKRMTLCSSRSDADRRVKGDAYLCGVRPGATAANLGLVNDVRAHA